MPHVPAITAALRTLPGVQDVRVGVDRTSGRTRSLMRVGLCYSRRAGIVLLVRSRQLVAICRRFPGEGGSNPVWEPPVV